jgi:hypothetical protein
MKNNVQFAIIPRVEQVAQPALIAAQFVVALKCIDNASTDASDAKGACESGFPACTH